MLPSCVTPASLVRLACCMCLVALLTRGGSRILHREPGNGEKRKSPHTSHNWVPFGAENSSTMPYAKVGALPQPQNDNHPPQKSNTTRPQGITMEVSFMAPAVFLFNMMVSYGDPVLRSVYMRQFLRLFAKVILALRYFST